MGLNSSHFASSQRTNADWKNMSHFWKNTQQNSNATSNKTDYEKKTHVVINRNYFWTNDTDGCVRMLPKGFLSSANLHCNPEAEKLMVITLMLAFCVAELAPNT